MNRFLRLLPMILPLGGVLNHLLGVINGDAFFVPGSFGFHLSTLLFDGFLLACLLRRRTWGFALGVCFYLFQLGLQSTRAILVLRGESTLSLPIQVLAVGFVGLTLVLLIRNRAYYTENDKTPPRVSTRMVWAVATMLMLGFAITRPML